MAAEGQELEKSRVIILGAGVGGLCAAVRLRQQGYSNITILEKSGGVGGTWRDNSYPGACCDVPSHFYSYSFAVNPDWTRTFSPQAEILAYLEDVARRFDILRHCRFNTEVDAARYDAAQKCWQVTTKSGESFEGEILISGIGQLNKPLIPTLPGLDQFQGPSFHSARWRHDVDLTGKKVAVIGNGASAVQFIPPVAEQAGQLTVFQRSANWIVPRNDKAYSPWVGRLFRLLPPLHRLFRAWIWLLLEKNFFAMRPGSLFSKLFMKAASDHLNAQVPDPVLRKVLTPDYPAGCKRILISDDFYPALTKPHVRIETGHIAAIEPDGVRTEGGTKIAADVLIFGTGFETTTFMSPIRIYGAAGQSLDQVWTQGAEAHLGILQTGFPNFFMLYGPNTNLGHNSIIFMIEAQVHYMLECLNGLKRLGKRTLDVKHEAQAVYNARLQRELKETVWATGCTSWYKRADGKITNNWSSFTARYWMQTREPDFTQFAIG